MNEGAPPLVAFFCGWGGDFDFCATQFPPHLKPDYRTKRDSQIIVRAIIEINFVANFKPQTYGSESCLHAGSRVDGCVQV